MKKIGISFLLAVLMMVGDVSVVKANGFSDVSDSNRFSEHILYLSNEGIINGFEDHRFAPKQDVTRAQAALMIARALHLNTEKQSTEFPDVGRHNSASGAIQSASEAGIINGFPDGTFRPDEFVTRGQMASFIARSFQLKEEEALSFKDVPVHLSSYSDVRKVIAFGVTEGYSDGRFKPGQAVNREQFSAFLARALNDELRLAVYTCGYDPDSRVNPDRQTMNCLLTKAAREAVPSLPPEILKAVASVESNGWKQFSASGEPIVSKDGGIGLMQITNTAGYDVERLKHDVAYNIEAGVRFLHTNFARLDLPKVADHDGTKLEHWYFAVMGYNGTKSVNSPFYKATGESNPTAYQAKVYREILNKGALKTNVDGIVMTSDDFNYGASTNEKIEFKKKNFKMTKEPTASKELYTVGDIVTYTGKRLRTAPSTAAQIVPTPSTDKFVIIGEPVYSEPSSSANHFVWFPVQTAGKGKKQSGYVASPSLQ